MKYNQLEEDRRGHYVGTYQHLYVLGSIHEEKIMQSDEKGIFIDVAQKIN